MEQAEQTVPVTGEVQAGNAMPIKRLPSYEHFNKRICSKPASVALHMNPV
jgi:hypothetical protein